MYAIRQGLSCRKAGLKRTSGHPWPGVTKNRCFSLGHPARNRCCQPHEHLTVFRLDLTVFSTCAMMTIIVLGTLLGLPRSKNTVAGWHKGVAWGFLPLIVLRV